MFEDLTWLIILGLFALFIFYSNSNNQNINENDSVNAVDNYRITNDNTSLKSYKNERTKRDTKVYIGEYPFASNNSNDNEFASHSIYEVGKINPVGNNTNYY